MAVAPPSAGERPGSSQNEIARGQYERDRRAAKERPEDVQTLQDVSAALGYPGESSLITINSGVHTTSEGHLASDVGKPARPEYLLMEHYTTDVADQGMALIAATASHGSTSTIGTPRLPLPCLACFVLRVSRLRHVLDRCSRKTGAMGCDVHLSP